MHMPEMLDNVGRTVKDDLAVTIRKGDRLSVAAACFSIYAYQVLKRQLDSIQELRFIFTSPTFLQEKAPKEKREFYIPRLKRERSLYGTEFEVKLRNELTQKAIARECADWISKKASFRSNLTGGNISGFMNIVGEETTTYMPLHGFTTADIGCERGNNIINPVNKMFAPLSEEYIRLFDQVWNDKTLMQDVTDQVIDGITAAYAENAPESIYFLAIYNIFNEFLEDISEDVLPNEATGFKQSKIWNLLYTFQKDAALAIINKLETFNGCILADSVGLGKTFTALAVVKYYENRNRSVLVLCPKKLSDNWIRFTHLRMATAEWDDYGKLSCSPNGIRCSPGYPWNQFCSRTGRTTTRLLRQQEMRTIQASLSSLPFPRCLTALSSRKNTKISIKMSTKSN